MYNKLFYIVCDIISSFLYRSKKEKMVCFIAQNAKNLLLTLINLIQVPLTLKRITFVEY